jgi:hypothetical protein
VKLRLIDAWWRLRESSAGRAVRRCWLRLTTAKLPSDEILVGDRIVLEWPGGSWELTPPVVAITRIPSRKGDWLGFDGDGLWMSWDRFAGSFVVESGVSVRMR